MVAALSEGRPKYAEHAALHASVGAAGRELAIRFLDLADKDSAAYAAYSAAMKLPRETDAERALRTAAIQAAARVASEVPLRCIEACVELVRAAEALAGRSNVNASSDLNVAALLGEAAARGAAANVLVNLASVGDERWSDGTRRRVDDLLADVSALAAETRIVVASSIAREPRVPLESTLAAAGVARP
jgi:glutamate formiminotransferase/formiminotetrahydrofolate cyclodeaminase